MKVSGIYTIVNKVNGKRYIGSSVDIKKRLGVHKRLCRNGKHHSIILQRAWDKYGEDNFMFLTLEEIEPVRDSLLFNEQSYIWLFRPAYNICEKPSGPPTMTEDRRSRLRERMSGANNHYFGKKRPDHSEKLKGANHYLWGKKKPPEELARAGRTRNILAGHQVYEVVELSKQGLSDSEIAKHFGCSDNVIYRLLSGKSVGYPDLISKSERVAYRDLNEKSKGRLVFDTQTGIYYGSIRQAAIAKGIDRHWLKKNIENINNRTGIMLA